MKVKTKIKDHFLIVRVRLGFNEHLDENSLEIFTQKQLSGFLKPKVINKKIVEYRGPIAVSLEDRMKEKVSKQDFFYIMEQIVDVTEKLRINKLYLRDLSLDMNHVFINKTTKEVRFIYLPIEPALGNYDVLSFIKKIIYSASLKEEPDMDYVSQFNYYLKTLTRYDAKKIEDYILSVDPNVVKTIRKHTRGQSGVISNKPGQEIEEKTDVLNENEMWNVDDDKDTALLDEKMEIDSFGDEETGLLSDFSEETGLLDETGLLEDDGTALLAENTFKYPTMTRLLTGEKITINKPVYRIGKEKSYVDYFVMNNNTISRSHADIICRNGIYYIKDLNSKNKTYINGNMIYPEKEFEINNGDILKFANEEFLFEK